VRGQLRDLVAETVQLGNVWRRGQHSGFMKSHDVSSISEKNIHLDLRSSGEGPGRTIEGRGMIFDRLGVVHSPSGHRHPLDAD
jgi:hypothetical protein